MGHNGGGLSWIACTSCGASTDCFAESPGAKKRAIAAWNRRAPEKGGSDVPHV